MNDDSGNGNNGTLTDTGATWIESAITGHGVLIDGVHWSHYMSVGNSATLTTQSDRTVSFWLKSNHSIGMVNIVSFNAGNGYGLKLLRAEKMLIFSIRSKIMFRNPLKR